MTTRSTKLSIDEKLDALGALGAEPDHALRSQKLEGALADKNFRVVAKAAALCGEFGLKERAGNLKDAYTRFLEDPIKRDPKCIAKRAILRALVTLDCGDVDFFMDAIRYRQMEPVWGGAEDAAVDIRCSSAMGLVASNYWRALVLVAELLADRESRAREGAAQAIAHANPLSAEALLRLKVLTGDPEPQVIGECFTGLLRVAPESSVEFVAARLLAKDDAIRDLAALALGQSRAAGVVAHLRSAWEESVASPAFRDVLIRAAAVHRSEEAFDWLLSVIETGAQARADAAVDALAVYERNTRLVEKIKDALARRQ